MTDLENKVLDKILEKIDIEELIEKIGYEKLTDKIAEKAAEFIVQKEYPDQPIIQPISPQSPWINPSPWKTEPYPISPVTVMYGVTPTEFKPIAFDAIQNIIKESESLTTNSSTKKEYNYGKDSNGYFPE